MSDALVVLKMPTKPKRINFHTNARSVRNEQIIGEFLEITMGGISHGLKNNSNVTGYSRAYLVSWVGQYFVKRLKTDDLQKPYNIHALKPSQVIDAMNQYREMIYIRRDSEITSVYMGEDTLRDWRFIWSYLKAYENTHAIEIHDLDAPQGDRRNLRMVIWIFLEIAARMIERKELDFRA